MIMQRERLLDPAVRVMCNLAITHALEILLKFIIHRISLVWCLEVSQWSTNCDFVGH